MAGGGIGPYHCDVPRLLPQLASLRRPSVVALIAANAVPLVGVFAFGWEIFPLVLLFWIENVIVGGFNVLRILCARPHEPALWLGKIFLVPFFIVHYGGFTAGHGVFVFALFAPHALDAGATPATVLATIRSTGVLWGAAALLASHGFSFVTNYLGAGEYRRAEPRTLMMQPYARVVVLHVTIIFGGMLLMALRSPVPGLVLLIALKIGMDITAHERERSKLGQKR
jgi:Family of unknown function (DUF6498)